jgi:hypothetical protein
MEPFHVAHLVVLGMWLGVVITEALFEFTASDEESLRAAARFHYNVDKFGELPILFAVLVNPGGARLATDVPALHQDCSIVGSSELQPDLHPVGIPTTSNQGRERPAGIPPPYLEPRGGRRSLRDSRSLSWAGLLPEVVADALH